MRDERLADFVVCSHMRSHPSDPDTTVKCAHAPSEPPIDQELLKKYILYARTNVFPSVADVDVDKISRFYGEIREASFNTGGVPMVVRHLESIVRLAQANARMELREYVSTKDVDIAIATMLECFVESQKHAIAERLRTRFSRYLVVGNDQHQLCLFLLEKEFRRAENMLSAQEKDEEAQIKVSLYKKVAEQHDLGHAINGFLLSEYFTKHFLLDEAVGSTAEGEQKTVPVILRRRMHDDD